MAWIRIRQTVWYTIIFYIRALKWNCRLKYSSQQWEGKRMLVSSLPCRSLVLSFKKKSGSRLEVIGLCRLSQVQVEINPLLLYKWWRKFLLDRNKKGETCNIGSITEIAFPCRFWSSVINIIIKPFWCEFHSSCRSDVARSTSVSHCDRLKLFLVCASDVPAISTCEWILRLKRPSELWKHCSFLLPYQYRLRGNPKRCVAGHTFQ